VNQLSAFTRLSTRKSLFFMAIGLIVFFLYLYFFVGFSNLFSEFSSLNSENIIFYYSLAILAAVLGVFFVAASWHDLLKTLSVETRLRSLFLYTWVGYFVDLMVPCQAVCGEVTRIYLVHNENHESYGAVAASSLTNRIISYVITSVGLLTGIVLVLTRANGVPPLILQLLVVALAGTFVYLVGLIYIAVDEQASKKVANVLFRMLDALRLSRFFPSNLPDRVQASLLTLHEGFMTFRNKPKSLLKPFLFQFLSMALNVGVYVLVFYSLGLTTLFLDFFIITYFIVGTVQIAAAVFSVGVLDIALANLFASYGVRDIGFGALAATMLRVLTFWMPIIVGYLTVQAIGARRLLNPKAMETTAAEKPKLGHLRVLSVHRNR
jgi:uncharacterized protein (TIRG00374 family)